MLKTEPEIDSQRELDTQPTELLVRYPDGTNSRLQMPGVKSTIGSGAGCTIPIRYSGVSPLHCVLFSTSAGWRIRRWSADTRLNGEAFTESSVDVGDRLNVGPVEIEFTGDTEPTIRQEIVSEILCENAAHEDVPEEFVERGPSWEAVATLVNEAISKQSYEVEQLRDQLTAKSDRVEHSLDEWRDRLREYGDKLSFIEQSRESNSADLAERLRQLEELRNLVVSRSDRFHELESDQCKIRDRLVAIGDDLEQFKQLHEATPEILAEQDRRLDEIRKQDETISVRLEEAESAYCGLRDQFAEVRQEITADKHVHSEIPERFAELGQQLDQLRSRVDEESHRGQHWENAYNELREQLNNFRLELEHSGQFHSEFQATQSELEGQLDSLRGQIADVSEFHRKSDSEVNELREKYGELQHELTRDRDQLSASQETIADQGRQLAEILNQVATIDSCHRLSDEGLNELRERFDGLIHESTRDQSLRAEDREAMVELGCDLNSLRDELARVPVEQQRFESNLRELRNALQTVREELVADQQFHASMSEALVEQSTQLESLQSQIASVSAQNEQFGASLSELREGLDVSSNSAADEKQAHIAVQEDVAQQKRDLDELRTQVAATSSPESGLENELKTLREELRKLRLDYARDEQLHLATREAVVELERQLAERPVEVVDAALCASREEATDVDSMPGEPEASNAFVAIETESAQVKGYEALLQSETSASKTESYQEPESFLNKYQHLLDEDEPNSVEPNDDSKSIPAGSFALQSETVTAAENAQAETIGEDDSIDVYMSQLLQRVRGEACAIGPAIAPKPAATVVEANDSAIESIPVPTIKPVSDLQEIKAAPAPERARDMTALRNLANSSARNSLHEAKVRRSREYALTKIFVSLFAIACGYIVIGLSPSYTSPEFIGGLVPVIAGVIWSGKTIVIIIQAIRAGSFGTIDYSDEPPAEIPIDLSADDL